MTFNQNSKILVIGTSGSGKSTLARHLAKRLHVQDLELDALFWQPGWRETPTEQFRNKISTAIASSDGFVLHGNYNKVRDVTWKHSETVIWLDYPRTLVMWRVLKRSVLRMLKREELWAGNKESFRKTFLSKDSIILWAWNTYDLRKKQYEALIREPEYGHVTVIRLTSQKRLDQFLKHHGLL